MVSQATEMHEGISAVPFHRHDTQVTAEVASVAPADGQSVPEGGNAGVVRCSLWASVATA